MECHAAGSSPRGARKFKQPICRDSKLDRRHFDRSRSKGNPRFAGTDQCRARYVAKRADQESGPLSGDPGAGIGHSATGLGARHRRTGILRNSLSADSLTNPFLPGVVMGFFATFSAWLNAQLATYIGDNTARLASVLEPAVVTLATIYVMAWGYLHLTGKIDEPFIAGLKRILVLALILGVGLRLWLYNTVIVDTFYIAPTQLAAAMIGSADPVGTIDAIWDRGGAVAGILWTKGASSWNFGSIGFFLAGVL